MSESEYDSEEELLISESGSDSETEEIFSETSNEDDSENEDVVPFREFVEVDLNNLVPAPPRYPFTNTPGISIVFNKAEPDILDYFEFFWNSEIMDLITLETNRYAIQSKPSGVLGKFSRWKDWQSTNNNELYVFLALHILQGIVCKPICEWYWSRKDNIATPFFGKVMSYKRFALLKRYLHFVDNSTYDANIHPNPKLYKLWPIVEHLNIKFSSALVPDRDITIDESLMLYKGRLGWIQFIPLKRARFGIKSYMLCESKSGYIWSVIIYTGKGTLLDESYKDHCMGTKIVMTLMKPLLNMGHCLTTDNFYTSPELSDILLQYRTDTYGTLRLNRKEVPKELQKKKTKKGRDFGVSEGKGLCNEMERQKRCFLVVFNS